MQGLRVAARLAPGALSGPRPMGEKPDARPVSNLLAVGALGLSALAAVLVLAASDSIGTGRILLHVLVVGASVSVGLYAVRAHRNERFGRMLMVAGFVWSLAILGEADSSLAYSTGRVMAWCIFPVLVYVML